MSSPDVAWEATFVAFARRGKTQWWRYLSTCVLALGAWTLLQIVVAFALALAGRLPRDLGAQLTTPSRPAMFFGVTGALFGLLLAAFVVAARIVQNKRFGDVVGAWRWRWFGAGALIWSVMLVVSTLIDYLMAPQDFSLTASRGTLILALAALAGLGVQTFTEEWIFRGWLTQGLVLATRRPLAAAIVSGLLFGAVHVPNGVPQAVAAVGFGVAAALIAIRTGGIAFTLGLHLVNNLFGAVVVISGEDVFRGSPGLIAQHSPGLMWWDVGVEMVGVATVLALVFWIWSRRTEPAMQSLA